MASQHAAAVIARLVDERRPDRQEILNALREAQVNLVLDVLSLENQPRPDKSPVIWVNTYFADNFEDLGLDAVDPVSSPDVFYVFSPSAVDPEEQPMCDQIHLKIKEGIETTHKMDHLSHLLGRKDAPPELRLFLDSSELDGSRLIAHGATESYLAKNLNRIQWYRDVLFPEVRSEVSERSSWLYVHLGLPHRESLAVRAAGVYFMLRSESVWEQLRVPLSTAFRHFLLELLFSHTYRRLHDKQRETADVFAAMSHELNALYNKYFDHIPHRLEQQGIEDVAHAWRLTAAMASLGSVLAKMMVSNSRRDEHSVQEYHVRFSQPLRSLAASGSLLRALRHVAQEVATRETPGKSKVRFPEDDDEPLSLEPTEFAVCYLLVAEPIRNHVNYGRGLAEWSVHEETAAVTVDLDAPAEKNTSLPTSKTFRNLGTLLRLLPHGHHIGSDATCHQTDGRNRWTITIGRSLLADF
jgi:hypothetical protein